MVLGLFPGDDELGDDVAREDSGPVEDAGDGFDGAAAFLVEHQAEVLKPIGFYAVSFLDNNRGVAKGSGPDAAALVVESDDEVFFGVLYVLEDQRSELVFFILRIHIKFRRKTFTFPCCSWPFAI